MDKGAATATREARRTTFLRQATKNAAPTYLSTTEAYRVSSPRQPGSKTGWWTSSPSLSPPPPFSPSPPPRPSSAFLPRVHSRGPGREDRRSKMGGIRAGVGATMEIQIGILTLRPKEGRASGVRGPAVGTRRRAGGGGGGGGGKERGRDMTRDTRHAPRHHDLRDVRDERRSGRYCARLVSSCSIVRAARVPADGLRTGTGAGTTLRRTRIATLRGQRPYIRPKHTACRRPGSLRIQGRRRARYRSSTLRRCGSAGGRGEGGGEGALQLGKPAAGSRLFCSGSGTDTAREQDEGNAIVV
ncbi:hypothetical protein B0H11DRAFT_559735 [Mycena galericulata]|nr:hypothetical protein B0H11DRAFT_559735 [Mycena galericulata]